MTMQSLISSKRDLIVTHAILIWVEYILQKSAALNTLQDIIPNLLLIHLLLLLSLLIILIDSKAHVEEG